MNKKSRIKAGLRFGIAMAAFFILKNLLTQDVLAAATTILTYLLLGLFGGAVAGLLFGWIIGWFTNSKSVTQQTMIDIDADETLVFTTGANHFKGAEAVGGKLYLTSKRLVFKSHKINIQNHELYIPLSNIDQVARYKILGLVNNGLSVTTAGNIIEKFVVMQPEEWLSQLTNKDNLQKLQLQ